MKILTCKLNYLIINLSFVFYWHVNQVVEAQAKSVELIADPVIMTVNDQLVIQNDQLPIVTNKVSVTLRLNLLGHDGSYAAVFHKGIVNLIS